MSNWKYFLNEYGKYGQSKFISKEKQLEGTEFDDDNNYCHIFGKGFGTCDFTEPTKDKFLTFTANEANSSVSVIGNYDGLDPFPLSFEYSYDGTEWNTFDFTNHGKIWDGEAFALDNIGDYVKIKGVNPNMGENANISFQMNGSISASGDVTSLINGIGGDAVLKPYCYVSMFQGCTGLTTAPELPATTLATYCYESMFSGCTSLTTAPTLPATTLANNCYSYMFAGCTSLTTAPVLPATTLAQGCYNSMFYGCTSLTTAPELPAETLVAGCYSYMFQGCSSLNYIKAMFLTSPGDKSTGFIYTHDWVYGVAASGTFVKNANATWSITSSDGIPLGWTVETA